MYTINKYKVEVQIVANFKFNINKDHLFVLTDSTKQTL